MRLPLGLNRATIKA